MILFIKSVKILIAVEFARPFQKLNCGSGQQAQFCAPLLSKLINPPMRAAIHRPQAHVTIVENPYPEQTGSKDSDSAVEI